MWPISWATVVFSVIDAIANCPGKLATPRARLLMSSRVNSRNLSVLVVVSTWSVPLKKT